MAPFTLSFGKPRGATRHWFLPKLRTMPNVVRTEVKTFNFGSNLGRNPALSLNMHASFGGNYEVNVMLKDIVERSQFNRENGDFQLHLLINGVQQSSSGTNTESQGFKDTDNEGDYFYDFSGIQLQESGFLDFQVVLRQSAGTQQLCTNDCLEYLSTLRPKGR